MYQLNQTNFNYKSYVGTVRNMYQKPVAQTSTALILTLFTITFFGFAAIRPTLATVSELVGELEEKRLMEEKIDTKLKALEQVQQQYLDNQQTLTIFDTVLPLQPNFIDTLFSVEYLASQHQVEITSLRQSPITIYGQPSTANSQGSLETLDNQFGRLNYRLSAQGQPNDLLAFVNSLNRIDRYFHLEQISFTLPEDDTSSTESTFPTLSLQFSAYWKLEKPITPPKSANPRNTSSDDQDSF